MSKVKKAPVVYSNALAARICDLLRKGESLNAICKRPGMPAEASVREWVQKDKHGFAAKYAGARELGYAMLAEDIHRIADTPVLGVVKMVKPNGEVEERHADMIEHRRLQVDTRKWLLSKMLPKIYGDRLEQTVKHEMPDELIKRLAGS